jgi:hypothetical protein
LDPFCLLWLNDESMAFPSCFVTYASTIMQVSFLLAKNFCRANGVRLADTSS